MAWRPQPGWICNVCRFANVCSYQVSAGNGTSLAWLHTALDLLLSAFTSAGARDLQATRLAALVLAPRRTTSPEKELNTTMLIALNATAIRVSAEEASRGDRYRCPACHDDVTLKQGAHVIWHFAHRAGSSCRHGDGESLRHLEMKAKVGKRLIARDLNVDYEVRIEHGKRHRITDLLINDPAVGVYVIECQVSPMDGWEYAARVRFYNAAGLPCLVL